MSAHNFSVSQTPSTSVVSESNIQPSIPVNNSQTDKPLGRVQLYLIELEVCLVLLRKVLLELKEVAFVIVMILFFIWSAVQLFKGIH